MNLKRAFFLKKKNIRFLRVGKFSLSISKRQRFVAFVIILSFGLFISENLFGKSSFYVILFLSLLTDILFYISMHKDLKGNLTPVIFILPFLFSFAFGSFYFLVPARFLSRLLLTTLYAIGLYSLYLSQNIFIVAAIRTIALLSGARIVSFVISIVSYFFLANIVFSLHAPLISTALLIFLFSFLFIYHCVWTHTFEKSPYAMILWVLGLALCLTEASILLWFWPSSPPVLSLFLVGFFYITLGLSFVWFDKRLFKNVIWEYVWVAVAIFCILIIFTTWTA